MFITVYGVTRAASIKSLIIVGEAEESGSNTSLTNLLGSLPAEHLSVLRHLVVHLRHICHVAASTQSVAVDQIGRVFGDILLRPPWTSVV